MSNYYEVGVMANKNVAKALDEFFESAEAKANWSNYERRTLSDGSTMYRSEINNHPSWFKIGQKFLATLHEFQYSKDADDAYRCILVSESGVKDEHSNIPGQEIFDEFDTSNEINYPEDFETADSVVQIEQALRDSDKETSSDVIGSVTAEADTWEVFEDLSARYIGGDAKFREGMDAALTIITGYNMAEIAYIVSNA